MGAQSSSVSIGKMHLEQESLKTIPDLRSMVVTVNINTIARRIFEALTVPEYQETWLSMPGHDERSYIAATRIGQSYRLNRHGHSGIDVSVAGAYQVFRRNKLHFTWQEFGVSSTSESVVQIRLHGDFGRTSVHLIHRGPFSAEEYEWHQEMWTASLQKLTSLLQGSHRPQ